MIYSIFLSRALILGHLCDSLQVLLKKWLVTIFLKRSFGITNEESTRSASGMTVTVMESSAAVE